MRLPLCGVAAALALARCAGAGGVFESGLGPWSTQGLWHRVVAPACVQPHSGTACVYYGLDSTCTYATGAVQDASLQAGPVALDSAAMGSLCFWLEYQVQSYDPQCQDQLTLELSADGAAWTTLANFSALTDPVGGSPAAGFASACGVGGPPLWQFHSVDLTSYLGTTQYFRFHYVSAAPAPCAAADLLQGYLGYALDEVAFGCGQVPLTLQKSVEPAVAAPGDTVTFTLTARNVSSSAASLQVWDQLPAASLFVAAAPAATLSGSTVQWSLPSVAASAAVTLTLEVKAPAAPVPDDWINTAVAWSSLSATAVDSSQVLVKVRPAGLSLVKSVNAAQLNSGDTATYSLLVENDTQVTQSALVLSDPLPAAFSLVQAAPPLGGGNSWSLPPLAPGQVQSFSLSGPVVGSDGQQVVNTATLSGGTATVQASASLLLHKPVQPSIKIQTVYPNPAPSHAPGLPQDAFVVYQLNADMPVTLDIYTLAGEKLRSLPAPGQQGTRQVAWDLDNSQGQAVASGVYLYRLWSALQVQPQPQATGYIAVLR
jgi:uncharacterized repeat protein (TIGR01451 family)